MLSFRNPEQVAARFWPKVDVRSADECWPWKPDQAQRPHGYGQFKINGQMMNSNRVALALALGELREQALHTCDNPPCCNPAHLFDGTQVDNIVDMVTKERHAGASGERNSHAKLTISDVKEIRSLLAVESRRSLANRFSVSKTNIDFIANGKTWIGVG